MKRQQFLRTLIATTLLGVSAASMAQGWPTKSVKLIIPFPPGGTLDTVGRMLAQKLTEQTGQSFFVENKPGGQGMIGGDAVAKAPADGYTLLFNASTFTTAPMTVKSAPYDVTRDFVPVALVAKAPLSIAINKNLPVQDLKGLIAYAGTYTLGQGLARWHRTGRRPTLRERREAYRKAYLAGRETVEDLARKALTAGRQ